ncbi:MAG: ABC transporter permease subunit [Rhizobiales bacterium]|nr:ABC transporter permease subunit [Hyphomicrobiales bacterium]
MTLSGINIRRLIALINKEFIQMRRDRLTFAMMIGVPIMQLLLFGYAINSDPKQLPTAVYSQDNSTYARSFVSAMHNSDYFNIASEPKTQEEADELIRRGKVQFLIQIPPNFSRDLVRGERPKLLLDADATDPSATGNAISAINVLVGSAFNHDLTGPLSHLRQNQAPVELVIHRRYNADGRSQYNIVPGLIGIILTMTMVMFTALAVTREIERGTMENLLTMPVKPIEVMIGKIIPYIFVAYVQTALVLIAAVSLFGVPFNGSLLIFSLALFVFVIANLSVGYTFSTLAQNQLQAMQMTFFFFLPSILLSGFMFPFSGMPTWAQWIGDALPLTHFLRIVRGIMLKGNGLSDITTELTAMAIFTVIAVFLALSRFRQTLD